MAKNYSKKRALKYAAVALACLTSFSIAGCSACNTEDPDDDKKTSKEDTQLLKNGNFEFFDVPEKKKDENAPVYLINSPNNWSHGGTTSYTMSGIISTADKVWTDYFHSTELADKLDINNELKSSDSDYKDRYVDYNGMKSSDLLYKDTYAVLNPDKDEDESEGDKVDPKTQFIENPLAHNIFKDGDTPYFVDENGERQTIYVEEETGEYYLEKDKDEYRQPVGHVLMLHNYATAHNGIAQNYSSVDISLPANTAAEVSVWVKTSGLSFHQGTEVKQDRGANIYVTHTAGSSSLSDFAITDINTEKLIKEGKVSDEYNGWVEYTVYINACDFASSTVSLRLGLGESDYAVEGYAFFDDVSVTKYTDLENSDCTYSANKADIESKNASCTLTSDASEKIFKADSYSRNDGQVKDDRFSDSTHYLVDLASEQNYEAVSFTTAAKAELTIDKDNYVSSKTAAANKIGFNNTTDLSTAKLPKDFTSLDTSKDLLAFVKANHSFTQEETIYYKTLNEALSSANDLPKVDANTDNNLMVMLSAFGAAYTSSFDLTVEKEKHQIISFWVKTSDLKGSTAATVKLTQNGNDSNSTSITLDSTSVAAVDLDADHKDIYNGWVQCFLFVNNELDEDIKLNVDFSYGNTTIKDTAVTAYKSGWVALANMQTLYVEEDVFAYTGSGSYTGSLSITEETVKKTNVFDEAYGSQSHEIENGMVNPSTYKGVNGASSSVLNNGHVSIPFDDINSSGYKNGEKVNEKFAGLINKDYIENYASTDWYKTLLSNFNASSTDALANWNKVFVNKSIQPLIIVNKLRESYIIEKDADESTFKNYYVKNEDGIFEKVASDAKFDEEETYYSLVEVMNYGFIGSEKSVSANSYATVSVRVRVSKGAVAYIYLVDTSSEKKVLGLSTPSYSFWYDEDGNVLKGEPDEDWSLAERRANVLYKLRSDGLYENDKGELFANTWNYTKLYKDNITYYTKDGSFSVDELVDGVTYYKDSACTIEADHFLVNTSGVKLYKSLDGKYHYIADGKVLDDVINPFELKDADGNSYLKYNSVSEQYVQKIDGNETDDWVTVNFVIHAGSQSKSYRLELWSGERDKLNTDGNNENGTIIFDYSYTSVSDDTLRSEYENDIILAYQKLLLANGVTGFNSSTENISYYEKLVEENGLTDKVDGILKNYTAHYYTYSLYDSASFQPFNKDVASAESTGYDYSINNYSESLAYLKVKDGNSYTIFTDYATVDQSISFDNVSDDDDDDDDEEEDNSNTNIWLLISSILLVVALIFAMIAIFVRDTLKKTRRNKAAGNNKYNQQRTNRYIKKLGIQKEEFDETDAVESEKQPEEPAEVVEQPAAEPIEETVEQPATESVESEEVVEKTTEDTTPEDGNEQQ